MAPKRRATRPSAALAGLLLASASTASAFVAPPPPTHARSRQHAFPSQHDALPTGGADLGLADVLVNPTETLAAVQAMASAQLLQSSDQVSAFVASLSSGDFSPIAALTAALSSSDLLTEAATPLHLAAIAAVALGSSLNLWLSAPDDYVKIGAPYLPGTTTYSPASSESFYAARPFLVAKRILKLATLTSAFNTGILFDWLVLGKLLARQRDAAGAICSCFASVWLLRRPG